MWGRWEQHHDEHDGRRHVGGAVGKRRLLVLHHVEEARSQISTLSATLSGMANDLKLAGGNLKSFAPSDELKQGFQQSSACKPYMH